MCIVGLAKVFMNVITSKINNLDMSNVPEELRTELLTTLTEVALKRIAMEAADVMSPENQDRLLTLQKQAVDPADLESFVREHVPDYDALVEATLSELLDEIQHNFALLKVV